MTRVVPLVVGLVLLASLAACTTSPSSAETGRLPVVVSIPPQVAFVEAVGGDRVTASALLGPGDSPATFDPTPRQVATIAEAVLYCRIGVPFETALMPRIADANPELTIVDTRAGIDLRAMTAAQVHAHDDHAHDDHGHAHAAGGEDPHIWLDPDLVAQQAATIAAALIDADPDGAGYYRERLAAFTAELAALDQRLAAALAPVRGRTLLVFHPSFGYFADAYGLHQEAIEVAGKEPSVAQLARIIERARALDARVVFVQPQFSRDSAAAVAAAIDGAVLAIDPLAPDWQGNLERIAATVADALEAE